MASEEQNKLKLEEIRLQREYNEAKKEFLESLAIEAEYLKDAEDLQQDQIEYFAEAKAQMAAATKALEEYNKKLEERKKKEEDLKKAEDDLTNSADTVVGLRHP